MNADCAPHHDVQEGDTFLVDGVAFEVVELVDDVLVHLNDGGRDLFVALDQLAQMTRCSCP